MLKNDGRTPKRDYELLDKLINIFENNILPKSIETLDKPIESLYDYEDILKWFIRMVAFIKNIQRTIEKKIKEEMDTESKTLNLDILRADYMDLEDIKAIFQKSADLYNKIVSMDRYEPELASDREYMDKLEQEYLEHVNNYIEFMDRTLKN